ncbi:DUF58 domain-containing protein [Embleya sp. AB8]|uniref:DUF58 domain-containing protein n=1 Tax=Embleya sp. AB8 TaxID=3156304 RepID=UPI003C77D24B
MLVGSVVVGVVGWWFGYPEGVLLGAAGLFAVATAPAWAPGRVRLSAERRLVPDRVPRGAPAESVVTLVNHGRRRIGRVRLADRCADESRVVEVAGLPPGVAREVRYAVPTERRGRITVGPLVHVRNDPLALARRTRTLAGRDTILVRPRVHPLPLLPAGRAHHLEGPTSATADGGSQTFHALREYVLGDDLRRVHWRSTARTGDLMVRQMVDVSLPHTHVVFDTRALAYAGDGATAANGDKGGQGDRDGFELAVETVASVVSAVAGHGLPVSVTTEAGTRMGARGGRSAAPLLDLLAVVETTSGSSLAPAFAVLERERADGTLIVVTGGGDPGGSLPPARITARFERVLVVRASAGGGGRDMAVDVDVAADVDVDRDLARGGVGRGRESGSRSAAAAAAAAAAVATVSPSGVPVLRVSNARALVAGWHREVTR